MKNFDLSSLKQQLEVIFPEVNIDVNLAIDNKGYQITLEQMYKHINISFDKLEQISQIFATKLIDISNEWSRGGCESCDYGSSYTAILDIRY